MTKELLDESKIELKITVTESDVQVEQETSNKLYLNTIALFIAELEAVKQRAILNMYGKSEQYDFEEEPSSGDSEKMMG